MASGNRRRACGFVCAALLFAMLAACAPTRPIMSVMTDQDVRACEAQGGSVQPAYALHQYVCYFPGPEAPAGPGVTPEKPGDPSRS